MQFLTQNIAPIMFAADVSSKWAAVALLGLAMAGHQGWSANMFTIISDIYPRRAVSSLIGITGFGGAVGGMILAASVGWILELTGSYRSIFLWAGISYFFALAVIHVASPRLKAVALD